MVSISDGIVNLDVTHIKNNDNIVARAYISKPIDGQIYKCNASFASPSADVIPDDSKDRKYDRHAPMLQQEEGLVPFIKSSKFIN